MVKTLQAQYINGVLKLLQTTLPVPEGAVVGVTITWPSELPEGGISFKGLWPSIHTEALEQAVKTERT